LDRGDADRPSKARAATAQYRSLAQIPRSHRDYDITYDFTGGKWRSIVEFAAWATYSKQKCIKNNDHEDDDIKFSAPKAAKCTAWAAAQE